MSNLKEKVMKREQTALVWFLQRLIDIGFYLTPEELEFYEQAKQMEKEQLEESHKDGQHYANNFEVPHQTQAEQYYESKYGKDETSRN